MAPSVARAWRQRQSMIPRSGYRFRKGSCSNRKAERDDDSTRRHRALAAANEVPQDADDRPGAVDVVADRRPRIGGEREPQVWFRPDPGLAHLADAQERLRDGRVGIASWCEPFVHFDSRMSGKCGTD